MLFKHPPKNERVDSLHLEGVEDPELKRMERYLVPLGLVRISEPVTYLYFFFFMIPISLSLFPKSKYLWIRFTFSIFEFLLYAGSLYYVRIFTFSFSMPMIGGILACFSLVGLLICVLLEALRHKPSLPPGRAA